MRLPAPFRYVVLYKFRETDDGRENIVEVVGYTSRERAEGFHLLRLAELLLGAPGLRDIEVDLQDCRRLPRLIPLEGPTAEHGDVSAVLGGMFQFSFPMTFFGQYGHVLIQGT